jgi:DNA/RNA endonuclease YhcR with UshA esterase domain
MNCPSCGRETPPGDTCAHCGATLSPTHRLPLGFFKWASLLLALAGVAALIVSASRAAVPQITIGHLNAAANLAYVRVSGTVVTTPRYDPDTQYLSFHLDDGTGELTVNAYRAETQSLISNLQIPSLGDRVTLEGTIRLREDSASLTLAAPERLVIEHPAPVERTIGSISVDDEHTLVLIRGELLDRREPYPGLTVLAVADPTGEIDAVIPSDVVALTGPIPSLAPGDFLELTGVITLYRDMPQITITSSQNIQRLDSLPAPIATRPAQPTLPPQNVSVGQITLAYVGATVTVEGAIQNSEDFSKGKRLTLADDTGSITLLLWQDVLDTIPNADQLVPGTRVRVIGKIDEYKGALEIVPQRGSDIVVNPSPSP